jgi:FkbM family methyltransferase
LVSLRKSILSLVEMTARLLPMSYKRALYSRPTISSVIRGGLNTAVPEGFTEVTIAAGYLQGMRMILDLQVEKDYWLGTYEPELQETIRDLTKQNQVFYDLGANIGYMTLLSAKYVGPNGHVFAFEALPGNVDRLKRNIKLNAVENWVTIVPAVVTDHTGETRFLLGPSSGTGKADGAIGRSSFEYQESISLNGISIDDFIYLSGNPEPDIVKIDIEGSEVLALPGMSKLVHDRKPILLIELHGPEAAQASWDFLVSEKYRICRMTSNYPQVEKLQELNWKSYVVAISDG